MSRHVWLLAGVVVFAAWAGYDLRGRETHTLVIYTTAAIRDLLEGYLVPRFQAQEHYRVLPSYIAAGEQYNRLQMSGQEPEVQIFLHASPLFIERGFAEGHFQAVPDNGNASKPRLLEGETVPGGVVWRAFMWSPLVEVYRPSLGAPPDLASSELKFGFPHPRLSNNGVYAVAFFQNVSTEAGERALAHTTVQPVNARANIQGASDGSFDVTLGYEAVVEQFRSRGSDVASGPIRLAGQNWTMPVVFSVGIVHGPPRTDVDAFLRFLFDDETQGGLRAYHFRPLPPANASSLPGLDADTRIVQFDWSKWEALEERLPHYEVKS